MSMNRLHRRGTMALLALTAALAACDDDSTNTLTPAEQAAAIRTLIAVGQGSADRVLRAGHTARVSARVTDFAGLPVGGVPVLFSTGANSGSIVADSGFTGVEGLIRATWTAGTVAGIQEVVATVDGGTGVLDRTNLVVYADTVVGTLDLTPAADSVGVGNSVLVVVTNIRDQYGNPYAATSTQPDSPPDIEFTTLDPTRATLTGTTSRTATVKGLAAGNARIVARSDGKADTVTVRVVNVPVVTPVASRQ